MEVCKKKCGNLVEAYNTFKTHGTSNGVVGQGNGWNIGEETVNNNLILIN